MNIDQPSNRVGIVFLAVHVIIQPLRLFFLFIQLKICIDTSITRNYICHLTQKCVFNFAVCAWYTNPNIKILENITIKILLLPNLRSKSEDPT